MVVLACTHVNTHIQTFTIHIHKHYLYVCMYVYLKLSMHVHIYMHQESIIILQTFDIMYACLCVQASYYCEVQIFSMLYLSLPEKHLISLINIKR